MRPLEQFLEQQRSPLVQETPASSGTSLKEAWRQRDRERAALQVSQPAAEPPSSPQADWDSSALAEQLAATDVNHMSPEPPLVYRSPSPSYAMRAMSSPQPVHTESSRESPKAYTQQLQRKTLSPSNSPSRSPGPSRSPPAQAPRAADSGSSLGFIRLDAASALSQVRAMKESLAAERGALSRSSSPLLRAASPPSPHPIAHSPTARVVPDLVVMSQLSSAAVQTPSPSYALEEVRHLKELLTQQQQDSSAEATVRHLQLLLQQEQRAHEQTRAELWAKRSTRPYGVAQICRIASRRQRLLLADCFDQMRSCWQQHARGGQRSLEGGCLQIGLQIVRRVVQKMQIAPIRHSFDQMRATWLLEKHAGSDRATALRLMRRILSWGTNAATHRAVDSWRSSASEQRDDTESRLLSRLMLVLMLEGTRDALELSFAHWSQMVTMVEVDRMSIQLQRAKEHSKIMMIRALGNSSSLPEVENCVREYQLVNDALQNTDLRKKITLFKVKWMEESLLQRRNLLIDNLRTHITPVCKKIKK